MPLDLTGQPLIDRSDFYRLLEQGQFGHWSTQAIQLHEQGFCVIDLSSSDFLEKTTAVINDLEPLLADQLIRWERGEASQPRLQDGWIQHRSIQVLAVEPIVLDVLRQLYGREPFAFQTLNFAVGSEQHYHSDAVHFHSYPLGFMCGVWIALQDVLPGSGPLQYYPGSHRLPYLTAKSLGLDPLTVAGERHPQRFFEEHWQKSVESAGFKLERFLPRQGEVLIWHANLLHGGDAIQKRASRRWSQVVHYFFADCLYTTPMRSFSRNDGGLCLRNPYDISTGNRRYSRKTCEEMGLERASNGHQEGSN